MKTSDIVKNSKVSKFQRFRGGNFMYKTDTGYEFPIPLEEVGTASLEAEEKTIFLMRWIRKHNES